MNDASSASVIPLRSASHVNLVAFLFTDVEGSSLKWLNHRAAMQEALRVHDDILRKAIAAHGGEVFKTAGDAFSAAFRRPSDAVGAAIQAQQALAGADWSAVDGLAVRMAVHVGTAERREGDYFGPALNRAARLLTLGHGGQVLVTSSVAELVAAEREHGHAVRPLGTHSLDDPLQPVALYQIDVPGLSHQFPPLRAEDNRPTNLPRQPTTLIGRESELNRLKGLLADHQLVTVTGTGGVGKTRLALEAGTRLLDHFREGVWLVELAPIFDPKLVPNAVTTALGIEISSTRTPLDALLSRLKHQEVLLLLDNCEHVIEAAAAVVEALIAVAPKVRVLVSSQEPLGIAGEHVFRLPSLGVPSETQVRAEAAMREGAVRLFVERAQAVDTRFMLDDRNASAVAAICRRLDGIPLAIEMAAARAPTLGVDKLAQKLDERFRVLTGGRRTALPRQQTLRATLDWSYGLLSTREGTVLRRLAIFAGGFTLEGAGNVASDDAIDEFEVIDVLSHLVARSLVVSDTDERGGTRYRLLETTRAYALEKLAEATESAAIERRHALFFRDLFERAHTDHFRHSDAEWLNTYLRERDNLNSALDWALGPAGDAVIGFQLMGTSVGIWYRSSLASEARHRLELMVPRLDDALPPDVAGRFWFAVGSAWSDIKPVYVAEAMRRAAELFRLADLPTERAFALLARCQALPETTTFDAQAQEALAEAEPLVERAKLPRLYGSYFAAQAIRLHASNPTLAVKYWGQALEHARSAGAERSALIAAANLANNIWANGDFRGATAATRDAVVLVRNAAFPNPRTLGLVLGNLAGVLIAQGDNDEALAAIREAVPLLRESAVLSKFGDHFSLRLAKTGCHESAARLLGYTDREHERYEAERQVNEARARASALSILNAELTEADLAQLMTEGAKISEEEAVRLALQS